MIIEPTVVRTLDTRSLIAVTVSGSNGDNVGGTVTVSKGGTSYTATTDSNGQCNIFVDSPGSWAVGYDKSGITASGSVSVVYSGYTYSVTLTIVQLLTVIVNSPVNLDGGSLNWKIYKDASYIGDAPQTTTFSITSGTIASITANANNLSFYLNGTERIFGTHDITACVSTATLRFQGSYDTYSSLTVNPGDTIIIDSTTTE